LFYIIVLDFILLIIKKEEKLHLLKKMMINVFTGYTRTAELSGGLHNKKRKIIHDQYCFTITYQYHSNCVSCTLLVREITCCTLRICSCLLLFL